MGRIGQQITLSDFDYQELYTRSKAHSLDHRLVIRAKIILLCAEGKSYKEIKDNGFVLDKI